MNLGALAGGISAGWTQGIKNQETEEDTKYKKATRDRLEKDNANEDAFKAEMKALDGPSVPSVRTQASVQDAPAAATQGVSVDGGEQQQPSASQSAATGVLGSPRIAAPPSPVGAAASQGVSVAEKPPQPTIADVLDKSQRQLEIMAKYGKPVQAQISQNAMLIKTLEDEGVKDAVMRISAGDDIGAERAINQSGKSRGWKITGSEDSTFTPPGSKEGMPTRIVTFQNANGETQTLNSTQVGFGMMKMENQISSFQKSQEMAQTAKHQSAMEGNQSAQLKESSRHNQAVEGIQKATAERREIGKTQEEINSLQKAYGEEEGKAMYAKKFNKGELDPYKQNKIVEMIAKEKQKSATLDNPEGGVTEKNVSTINMHLRSLGEPPYVKKMVTPETSKRTMGHPIDGVKVPATYEYVQEYQNESPTKPPTASTGPAGGMQPQSGTQAPGNVQAAPVAAASHPQNPAAAGVSQAQQPAAPGTGGLRPPEEVMKRAAQMKAAREQQPAQPASAPQKPFTPPTDAQTIGVIAGKVGNGLNAAGNAALAFRDAGEKLGTTKWWGERGSDLKAATGWTDEQMMEAAGWTTKQVEAFAKETGKSLDEIVADFNKGYSSTNAR